MTIGRKIREIRENNHLTQEEFAQKLNRSQKTISSWERDRTSPDMEETILICNIFGISLNSFQSNPIKPIEFDPIITELEGLMPKLTQEQKQHILQTARLFAFQNNN